MSDDLKDKMKKGEHSTLTLSVASDNSTVANVSTPRAVMHSNHMASRPSLIFPEKKQSVISGVEYELGKYIDDIKANEDCIFKGSVLKYQSCGLNNPETMLLVQFEKQNEEGVDEIWLDLIKVKNSNSKHTYFGYRLHPTEELANLRHNSPIPKDTILAKTDSYNDDGFYNYGVNANVAYMSHPGTAEDGFVVSRSFVEKLQFTTVEKRTIYLDKKTVPVNLYGDENNFKMFPDIGEKVRDGGLLCAVRERNDFFAPADLNNQNIMEIDHTFDNPFYVEEDSYVVDIKVVKANGNKPVYSENMSAQLDWYHQANVNYAQALVRLYDSVVKELRQRFGRQFEPHLTGELNTALIEARVTIASNENPKTKLRVKSKVIDQYMIEITCMSVVKPDVGFKLTDICAGETLPGY